MKNGARKTRRWFRFGIRTLIVLITIVAAFFGLFLVPTMKQRAALEKINEYSGEVSFAIFYDYYKRPVPQGYSHWNIKAELPGPKFLHRWLGEDAFRTPVLIGTNYAGADDKSFYTDLNQIQSWEDISFDGTRCNDAMISELTGQPHLETLRVNDTQITDRGCTAIGKLVSLRKLHADKNKITDVGLAELGSLRNLEELFLGSCQFDGSGFEHFENPLSLKRLDIDRSVLSDESGKWIGRFKNLETLYLYKTQVTDKWLANVGGLPNVTWFNLAESEISGQGFRDWPVSQSKTGISVDDTNVDNDGWLLIKKKFPNGVISGRGAGMTREILKSILAQPNSRSLNVSEMQLLDEDYSIIAACETLESVTLNGTNITTEQLNRLLNLKMLDYLSVKDCPNLDDKAFEVFKQMPLGELEVSAKQYSKEVVRAFEKEYRWEELNNESGMLFSVW